VSLLTDAQQPNKGRSHRGKRVHNESTPPNAQLDDPTLDISINTDILQRHRLTFTIDPDIITNEIQAYRFPDVLEGSVTVTATGGSVSASFHGNKTESLLLDGKGNNNHPRSHRFAEEVADGKAVIFSLSVTGKQKGSQYTLDGDVTRGTSGGPQGRKFDPDHSSLPPH